MKRAALSPPAPSLKKTGRFRWVFYLGMCLAAAVGIFMIQEKENNYQLLLVKLNSLEEEKREAISSQEELLLQIQSQSDPEWVEMVLKRQLGMVRHGQTKIYFHNNS
ncbi:hypothetical protein [Rhabdochlamydiaceae symbiont of Dictyostelium giganteum]|uniref:hypothetical protein n=1 Tax=Rhabdochlamydiaceae symbiont of Dictyostelium giganteum TaxID=3342349 RepID=UPI00384D1DA7